MARPTVDPAFDGVLSMLDNAAAARREVCGGGEGGARGAVAAGGCMGGQVVRPFVTLCFAQSVDGSIAPPRGYKGGRLVLSGDASMHMTHRLRAWHDGILVGVGTVLADNPSLTVRLCEGRAHDPSSSIKTCARPCPAGSCLRQTASAQSSWRSTALPPETKQQSYCARRS